MKKVVIAGASGFIGTHLINALLEEGGYEVIGLSRGKKVSQRDNLTWMQCDLFSVLQIEKVLEGADLAYYLVHSMQPSARLDQANFIDYDLLLVDNFGRAAQKKNVNKVVYLSGIIPDIKRLSDHLLSRLEVEDVLKQCFEKTVILRAGLVLGRDGSSFNMLLNLVKRLPVMICPNWTNHVTSPVYYKTVIEALKLSIVSDEYENKTFDLSSKDNVSYLELLKLTSKALNLKRFFFKFPFNLIFFSRLWVSLFSGASRRLVYPLLESLSHSMIPRDSNRMKGLTLMTVEESINLVVQNLNNQPYKFHTRVTQRNTVRSVQRFTLPDKMDARAVAMEYMHWLPRFLFPFIIVDVEKEEWVYFSLLTRKIRLLILKWSPERSSKDRQLFYIKGGLLADKQNSGRLEFREVLNRRYTLAAIHDFKPSLPWYVYRNTQAIIHFIVMIFFGRHLYKISNGKRVWHQKY
jgi:uncharacterized protein YbjT (DUF2867 family)